MSKARRTKRAQQRAAEKHFEVLGELLMGFYEFLEQTPQPADEHVRAEFIERESKWKRHCAMNKLNQRTTLLFNQEVALSWNNRYAKPQSSTTN